MTREEAVVKYYVLCNRLKNVIRTGWKDWNVDRERLESVAEHVFGVQMLAIAMNSEYDYDVDISKVIMMLAIHELEEIYIGDLTQFQISKDEKIRIGHEAVEKILSGLLDKTELMDLILEYDKRESKEALFAHYCDKLECDLQSKLYDEEGCVDLNNQDGNATMNDPRVQSLLNKNLTWSQMWLLFGQETYGYEGGFKAVSEYALTHKISSLDKK